MTAKQGIFNPALFVSNEEPSNQEEGGNQVNEKKAEYPLTGNPSRDSVRKLFFEAFQGDP